MELAAHLLSSPPIIRNYQVTSGSHSTLHFPKVNVQDPWNKQLQACWCNKLRVRCSQVQVEVEEEEEDEEEEEEEEACELVNGSELTIALGAGEEAVGGIQACLFKAVKNNNATGILLLSDIYGYQDDATRDFAYRVACGGYNVLVPDLFNGNPWTKDDTGSASFEEWRGEQSPEHIREAVVASAKWLSNEFEMVGISKKLGMIGFCGQVVEILAEDGGAYFGCGVCFYGTKIDTCVGSKVKVPLLVITGKKDEVSVLEEISEKKVKMVLFPGRGHGFAHRPQSVEEDGDAEEAFELMRDWLAQGLLAQSESPASLI